MITKDDLKKGITLDNSLNAVYAGKLTQCGKDIINIMIDLYTTAKQKQKYQIKVDNRIYEITQNYIKYYSLNGEGYYYYIKDWEQIYDYITKPVKKPRKIKLLSADEIKLNRKQKKAI